jgi:hypothetical protein
VRDNSGARDAYQPFDEIAGAALLLVERGNYDGANLVYIGILSKPYASRGEMSGGERSAG